MKGQQSFAIWITGMPASGKSSVTRELVDMLRSRGIPVVALESDVMRTILTPDATYSDVERDRFYDTLTSIGLLIAKSNVTVIFDATANKRAYREAARAAIPRFVEVFIQCPLEVCRARDPKGIYRSAAAGKSTTVPGLQSPYEPPENPDLILDCRDAASKSAQAVVALLEKLRYI
jgi:adenylylsulfate kinase